ncbi:MAG: DUF1634 domain-containing protein [Hyphomicrobiales bacterium]|nr:DUF1634 domain-containing protein [Hyphomicrobiales bacterium]
MRQRSLEGGLAFLLGTGTWLACAVLTAGILLQSLGIAQYGTEILWIGIAGIIALPVIRVAIMALHFARARQWRFAATAATVLLIIVAGVVAGLKLI